MTKQDVVPEKAATAGYEALVTLLDDLGPLRRPQSLLVLDTVLQAALPHIEADLEARWRERLLSEEFARSVYWALPIHESNGLTIWQLKRAIADAALFGRAGLAAIERRSQ